MYIQEAREIQYMMGGVHHARKISHLQVSYPETITRLSAIQSEKSLGMTSTGSLPMYTTKPPSDK